MDWHGHRSYGSPIGKSESAREIWQRYLWPDITAKHEKLT